MPDLSAVDYWMVHMYVCLERGLECAMENSDRRREERLSRRRRKELYRLKRDGSTLMNSPHVLL